MASISKTSLVFRTLLAVILLAAPLAAADLDRSSSSPLDELEPLFNPKPQTKAACSASFACGDGNTASCTGNSSCATYQFAVPAFVKCDGAKHYCPNMCYVEARCTATGKVLCSSNVGNCQSGSKWVQCDGNLYECPFL